MRGSSVPRRSSPRGVAIAVILATAWTFSGWTFTPWTVADDPPEKPVRRYAGLTLEEWDERIKAFPFDSAEASRSVPGLISIVDDPGAPWMSRRQAALTLGRMGKPAAGAVPTLRQLVLSGRGEEETRLWALTALARFGPLASEAAPEAAKILENSEEPHLMRLAATELLGRIGPAHAAAFDSLLGQIAQPEPGLTEVSPETDLRVACTDALALFGGSAAAAVPHLMRQMRQPGDRVRQASLTTLAAIGPGAEPAAMSVAEIMLRDPTPLTRDRAAEALVTIDVEPLLLRLLGSPQPETRERLAKALEKKKGPVSPSLTAAIRGLLRSDMEPAVRAAALRTEWAWTKDSRTLAPLAVELLGSDSRDARKAGYEVLGKIGEDAADVAPELQRVAREGNPQAAAAAKAILDRLRRNGAGA